MTNAARSPSLGGGFQRDVRDRARLMPQSRHLPSRSRWSQYRFRHTLSRCAPRRAFSEVRAFSLPSRWVFHGARQATTRAARSGEVGRNPFVRPTRPLNALARTPAQSNATHPALTLAMTSSYDESQDLDETAGQRPFSVSGRCLNSSMSSQPVEHLHPVLDFAHRLVSRLDSLADAPLMSMRPEDKRAALVTLAQGRAQLEALALRLLADAERSEATVESGAGTRGGLGRGRDEASTPRGPRRPPAGGEPREA